MSNQLWQRFSLWISLKSQINQVKVEVLFEDEWVNDRQIPTLLGVDPVSLSNYRRCSSGLKLVCTRSSFLRFWYMPRAWTSTSCNANIQWIQIHSQWYHSLSCIATAQPSLSRISRVYIAEKLFRTAYVYDYKTDQMQYCIQVVMIALFVFISMTIRF